MDVTIYTSEAEIFIASGHVITTDQNTTEFILDEINVTENDHKRIFIEMEVEAFVNSYFTCDEDMELHANEKETLSFYLLKKAETVEGLLDQAYNYFIDTNCLHISKVLNKNRIKSFLKTIKL